ncbi:MAG: hypothetical protein GC139_01630 [Sideroxydans sp.]|nr:hypothetical protein [Sideroxydans sp.]
MNADCHAGELDYGAVERALRAQGDDFWHAVKEERPHLCACAAVFISAEQLAQMRAVIAAVEQVVALPAWRKARLGEAAHAGQHARGVFFGYDFHLNADGAHLIEINTNAGGAFFNVLLLDSQKATNLPGAAVADADLEQSFVGMFRDEWRLTRGDAPLRCIAIIDEQPLQQYLHPEFVLAQRMFERAGITALIVDPSELELRGNGLYCGERKIDLVYNRLTDFSLAQFAVLDEAFRQGRVVLTPHPDAYALYADKRNLAVLTDASALRELGAAEATIDALLAGIPQVRLVDGAEREQWRAERKQWFFKPATGYGGKGSYRGANVTNRVFDEIMQGGYVAQKMAAPGERILCPGGAEPTAFKVDVRCYVYAGRVQLVVARLYQGQATNFRTPGGGFALVRRV